MSHSLSKKPRKLLLCAKAIGAGATMIGCSGAVAGGAPLVGTPVVGVPDAGPDGDAGHDGGDAAADADTSDAPVVGVTTVDAGGD